MSISRLIRWGGLAGAAGGVLWVVLLAVSATLPALAIPLINVGIVALCGHQRRRAGWFGRFAFVVGCGGAAAMLATRLLVDFADVPGRWFDAALAAFYAGLLLFGLSALLVAKCRPRRRRFYWHRPPSCPSPTLRTRARGRPCLSAWRGSGWGGPCGAAADPCGRASSPSRDRCGSLSPPS